MRGGEGGGWGDLGGQKYEAVGGLDAPTLHHWLRLLLLLLLLLGVGLKLNKLLLLAVEALLLLLHLLLVLVKELLLLLLLVMSLELAVLPTGEGGRVGKKEGLLQRCSRRVTRCPTLLDGGGGKLLGLNEGEELEQAETPQASGAGKWVGGGGVGDGGGCMVTPRSSCC